jgi:hypothetical protein
MQAQTAMCSLSWLAAGTGAGFHFGTEKQGVSKRKKEENLLEIHLVRRSFGRTSQHTLANPANKHTGSNQQICTTAYPASLA